MLCDPAYNEHQKFNCRVIIDPWQANWTRATHQVWINLTQISFFYRHNYDFTIYCLTSKDAVKTTRKQKRKKNPDLPNTLYIHNIATSEKIGVKQINKLSQLQWLTSIVLDHMLEFNFHNTKFKLPYTKIHVAISKFQITPQFMTRFQSLILKSQCQ